MSCAIGPEIRAFQDTGLPADPPAALMDLLPGETGTVTAVDLAGCTLHPAARLSLGYQALR
ncbi:hypothetical protein [Actinospica robiniae]|uniref:hypothetical protein n=1 Tax=Actinospica robiniae TaxID=304901 RepID=UPI00042629A8|nr:hypothetical protein [Actinospica robiniae]